MARRGAGNLEGEKAERASGAWRRAMASARDERPERPGPTASVPRGSADDRIVPGGVGRDADQAPGVPERGWEPELWIREDDLEREATGAVERGRAEPTSSGVGPRRYHGDEAREPNEIQDEVRAELAKAVGVAGAGKLEGPLRDATRAFDAERFTDAARILKRLADQAPTAASVRELFGLTLYRQGKWRQAAHELEAFRQLTASTEQHPVLADCYRALERYDQVDELWLELRRASPGVDLVTEGRIVTAGAYADRGDMQGAIRLLEDGFAFPKRPREHHLRRAYALADAYERAGEVVRARELFTKLQRVAPDLADVGQRVRALR